MTQEHRHDRGSAPTPAPASTREERRRDGGGRARPHCPMDALLRLLMGPWTTYLLWILRSHGPQRFLALKRRVAGISSRVLTERLRMLEAAGIVRRSVEPTIPPAVTYALTRRGEELGRVLDELERVARRWDLTGERPPAPEAPAE